MKSFSALDRTLNIQRMQQERFDLAIIGGGINGAGVAREAALRGMKVALIEANDFASGTSSRSSKLIHGGLRYLENLEFNLVFEALNERHHLLQMAPHLVHPLKFTIPLYKGGRVSPMMMGLGMWFYDVLSQFEAPELHARLNPEETLEEIPFLREKELLASFQYYDAYMDDDRLTIETIRSANEAGLCAANYVRATGCGLDGDGLVQAVTAKDLRSNQEFMLKADHYVSSVGPWVDELGTNLFKSWQPRLRPTKGIHLTFRRSRFPLKDAVVMAAEERILFAIPRQDFVIVGTTDTDFQGDLSRVFAEPSDVAYLMQITGRYFPHLNLKVEDVVASYAGVRPLVRDQAETTGKTSREHTIVTDKHGITYVMGGKYTTYRKIAQETVDEVLSHFSLEKRAVWARSNSTSPLNPQVSVEILSRADLIAKEVSALSLLPVSEAKQLIERHGLETLSIIKSFGKMRSNFAYEAAHAITMTMCLTLKDFYFRRMPLYLANSDHGISHLDAIVDVFASFYNWSDVEKADQIEDLRKQIGQEMQWKSAMALNTAY